MAQATHPPPHPFIIAQPTAAMDAHRIVSLLPSATDWLMHLGVGNRVVGRTHLCPVPDGLRPVPVLTAATEAQLIESANRVHEHDAMVALKDVEVLPPAILTPHPVNLSLLRNTQPQLIILPGAERPEALAALRSLFGDNMPQLIWVAADTVAHLKQEAADIANGVGKGAKWTKIERGFDDTLAFLQRDPLEDSKRPSLAVLTAVDPYLRTAGGWQPELIALAGGRAAFGENGQPGKAISWEQLIARDPDKILFVFEGQDLETNGQRLQNLHQINDLRTTRAFRAKQVFVGDAASVFSYPLRRLPEALQTLREILHPQDAGLKLMGRTWMEFF